MDQQLQQALEPTIRIIMATTIAPGTISAKTSQQKYFASKPKLTRSTLDYFLISERISSTSSARLTKKYLHLKYRLCLQRLEAQ